MAGFEVAGAVLGVIPLVVSALENYRNGVQALKKWKKYENNIQCLIRNITVERVRLQNVCEKLLDGLVPPSQIDAMVDNHSGDLWTNEEVQHKIRLRLWKSSTVFEETLRDIQVAMIHLSERVGSGSDIRSLNTSLGAKELTISARKELKSSLNRELKRVEFLLRQSTYEELLNTVKDGVSSLESLAALNIELEPKRRVRSRVRLLDIVRGLSTSLYRAVSSSLMCACNHRISMRVSDYKGGDITPDHDDEYVIQNLEVHLALTISRSQFDESKSVVENKQWKELLIKSDLSFQAPVPKSNSLSNTIKPMINSTKQKHVKFRSLFPSLAIMSQTETPLISSLTTGMSLEETGGALTNPSTQPEISQPEIDLCKELKKSSAKRLTSCYFGVISDKANAMTRTYSVSPSNTLSVGKSWTMVSLKDSLESGNVKIPTYKQRLQLSVFIAKSVLQFYKTPWLPEMPSSRDIFFAQSGSSSFDYNRPFLMASSDTSEAKPKTINSLTPTIRSPTLLAIGVLLIELFQGQTIESLQAPEETLGDPLSLYTTASRLLRGVSQASSNYGTAVSRCIDGKIQGKNINLEFETDRHDIYCGVVALLEEDLRNS